ncbi:MAG TPA: acyltransferase family protein, partial [Ilumatobacteraceae bacterium]|nr:acyltransferase family protein [Ilumatobacteraceae bacterium]
LESRWIADPHLRRRKPPSMGYQPGLDGLRAISVIAVIFYHAGFEWMRGGFLGVEVFFVVSGYLITSLLLQEKETTGGIRLSQFWLRRARRLLPALFAVLIAIGVWVALFGSLQQQSDLHRDYLPGIFYFANWGQIVGGAQYFGNFSPLRHLWSLAVEEQWYLLWPLTFVLLARRSGRAARTGRWVLLAAVAVMALTSMLAAPTDLTSDRINFLYLSTFTRASGLLLGAGAAFVWRPWKARSAQASGAGAALSAAGFAATALLLVAFHSVHLTDRSLYRWQLACVSLLSLVAISVVVHPAALWARAFFGSRPLVAIGKRSYGIYLWSWPISVVCGAYDGTWKRFIWAMCVTAVVSEFSYTYIETPIRRGALREWFRRRRDVDWSTRTIAGVVVIGMMVVSLSAFFAKVQRFDRAAGGEDVAIDLGKVQPAPVLSSAPSATDAAGESTPARPAVVSAVPTSAAPAVTTTAPSQPPGPARVVIVGDSQAHSLAINLPTGIESAFTITDGSVEGCSVYDNGKVRSQRAGFSRSFADCGGWARKWGQAASRADAQLALVVLGAWDVFDVEVDGQMITFGTPPADQRFIDNLNIGIADLRQAGARVALLEVPCMRPKDVKGAGVPALPERADDSRVAHLNDLLRQVAATDPANIIFVSGPTEWCNDAAISTDLGYRWDGVHVYKPGAKLIYETIAPALLAIPRG